MQLPPRQFNPHYQIPCSTQADLTKTMAYRLFMKKTVKRLVKPPRPNSPFAVSYTPIHTQKGIITPSGLHFGSHHSGVPDIASETHEPIHPWFDGEIA